MIVGNIVRIFTVTVKIRKLSSLQNIFYIVKDTKFCKYILLPPQTRFLIFAYNEMFLTHPNLLIFSSQESSRNASYL